MTRIRRSLVPVVLGLVLFPFLAFADTIYLKNGQEISGEIYKEDKYAVKIRVNGKPRTVYRQRIERIKRGGESPSGEPQEVISEQKKELILRLLEANGTRDHIRGIFMQIITQAPEEAREEARALLKPDEMIQHLIPIYDTYYTKEELQELIRFYKSPTGRKHLETIPKIMEDTLREAVTYFKEKVAAYEEQK